MPTAGSVPLLMKNGSARTIPVVVGGSEALKHIGVPFGYACPIRKWLAVGGCAAAFDVAGTADQASPNVSRGDYMVHWDGMPGCVSVNGQSMLKFRRLFVDTVPKHLAMNKYVDTAVTIGVTRWLNDPAECSMRCVAYAIDDHVAFGRGADALAAVATSMRDIVKPTVPYAVGVDQTTREVFDTTPEACAPFGNFRSGDLMLHPRGVAACVGVALEASGPMMYWHAGGMRGAQVLPFMHAGPSVKVGEVEIGVSGPRSGAPILQGYDVGSYLHDVGPSKRFDTSKWLCEGLFGATAGATLPGYPSYTALGVGKDKRGHLDLFAIHRKKGGQPVSLTDLRIFGDNQWEKVWAGPARADA